MLIGPPIFSDFARPCEPAALLIVAVEGSPDPQVTCVVRFWVLLSENVPVAVYCCDVPFGIVDCAGAT